MHRRFRRGASRDAAVRVGTVSRALARLVTGIALAACQAPNDAWQGPAEARWRPLVVRGGDARFTPMDAAATGLALRNVVDDEHALANRHLLLGAGAAIADIDGDGLLDVFLAATEAKGRLYRNRGDLRFADVTDSVGLSGLPIGTTGAAFADVDRDGDADLVVGTLGGPLMLWRNDGAGRFTDATASSGLDAGYAVTTLTLADIDRDGDLDLYAATYKKRNALDAYPPQARAFDQVVKKTPSGYEVLPAWRAEYRVEDRPDLGGVVRTQRAEPDLLYRNDGTGTFTRVQDWGTVFRDADGRPVTETPDFFTLAARFYDANDDGFPDLYVCNDFEDPDQFWLGDGRGGFRLATREALRATSNTCMSVDFADVNADGHSDLFTADMLAPTRAERQRQIPTHTPLPKPVGESRDRPQWMRNMLHLGRGDGTWAEVGQMAGVAATDWTWGSAFTDVDLDGFPDLVVANGHRWDIRDGDVYERIRNAFPRVAWNREQGEFPRLAVPDRAFRNRGDGTFEDANTTWRFGTSDDISHAVLPADLDGDGDDDVLVTRLGEPPRLYRNDARAPRLAITLRGPATVGARVRVAVDGLPVQQRESTAGGYYLGGVRGALTFAAREGARARVTITWPDGAVQQVDADANREYECSRPRALTAADAVAAATDTARGAAAPVRALFADASALLGGHTHTEALFDDFRRQPLLPERLSQGGPGITWADLAGDGNEALFVGTGAGGRVARFAYRAGRFVPGMTGPTASADLTTVLPMARGLVAGQSWYESATPAEASRLPALIGLDAGAPALAPLGVAQAPGAIGALAAADVDADGELEIFVGARAIPGRWPLPAPSYLMRRASDGTWRPDPMNGTVLSRLGLVTSAIFTDLTGDGYPELVVAVEFGPVRILQNTRGAFEDVTAAWGIEATSSRWRGVASGDFDGDGRMDLVVTADGANTSWQATPERPLVLEVGDFGSGVGLLFAQADRAGGVEYPLESYPRMTFAIPSARDRFATFAAFAAAPLDSVLGLFQARAQRIGSTTNRHRVLLNRGRRFEVRELPEVAQRSAAHGIAVADFNGDGRTDLVLAQNLFPTNVELPRNDAGAGLVLLGDGRGGFTPLSTPAAGLAVRGDARGAAVADYDADGRPDVAIGQNGGRTTLGHNVSGQPGLRVRLVGPEGNPTSAGAAVRLVGRRAGAAQEVRLGNGYWSVDAPTLVVPLLDGGEAIEVRWPGGAVTRTPLPATAGGGVGTLRITSVGVSAARSSSR
ncbi:MAG: VCBS repeat-containing protein [Gemmatimonadaceae bacterium]|nr:VCBS repeat-containing protein [Gemmatimonadaceae bacterium]